MSDQPFPQREYTPLCIVCVPRSGSNLLSSLLNNHPDILVHGEIFSESTLARESAPSWQQRPRVPYAYSAFRDYLETQVFPEKAEDKRIIGFKLFPQHLNAPPDGQRACTDTLLSVPGLKIILLVRENLLDLALSALIASRDNAWTHFNAKDPPVRQIDIKPSTLFWRMERIQEEYAQAETLVQGRDVYRLTYDDLVHRTDEVLQELQKWLGLPVRKLQPNGAMRKQRLIPRREALLNFDALRAQCARDHPEWLRFFDEPEHLTEVLHRGRQDGFSVVWRKKQSEENRPTSAPAFYLQLFRDAQFAHAAVARIRRHYPFERIILQSDGDSNPSYRTLADMWRCEYAEGERLYLLERGGRMIQRMLNDYLCGPGDCLIKIDTDTRIDRRFIDLPAGNAIYGSPLRQGPPQGGCVVIPRAVAQTLRDSRVFLSPQLKNPASSWGAVMAQPFLHERIESTGCIGFEWTLYWGCMQLGIPVLAHPEIHATWKQGHINRHRTFAAVHPDKFIHISDKSVHDLCTVSHAGIHTVWLDAINHST
jgi:hypothetical protein